MQYGFFRAKKSSAFSKAPGSAKVPSLLSRSSSATEPPEYWAALRPARCLTV
jgi:hypothetical protein